MQSWSTLVQTTYAPRLIDIIDSGYDINLRDYPIYNESYRDTLNQSIVDHFLLREIAAETPALFIFYLNRKMRENMPLANYLYQYYEQQKNNMLDEYYRISEGTDVSESSNQNESETTAKAYASTNPQINMDGRNNEAYYNSGTQNDGTSSGSAEGKSKNERKHQDSGRNAGIAAIVEEFAQNFKDVDQIVFEFLEPCFSQLFTDHVNGL